MKRSMDGFIQQRQPSGSIVERESSSGTTVQQSTTNDSFFKIQLPSKTASLPVQIAFFPLNFAIASAVRIVQLSIIIPKRAWQEVRIRLGIKPNLQNNDAIFHSGKESSLRSRWMGPDSMTGQLFGWVDRTLSSVIVNRVFPLLSHLITFSQSVAPVILNQRWLEYLVPFALWKVLIVKLGSPEQRSSIGAVQNGGDAQKVSAQTYSLRAQKAQLEEENSSLKLRLKDIEAGFDRINRDLTGSSEELKNNRMAVKENEKLRLKLKEVEDSWAKMAVELKAAKAATAQLNLLQQENTGLKQEIHRVQGSQQDETSKSVTDQRNLIQQENAGLKLEIQQIQIAMQNEAAKFVDAKVSLASLQQEIEKLHAQHADELTRLEVQIRQDISANNSTGGDHRFEQEVSELREEMGRLVADKLMLENEAGVLRQQLDEPHREYLSEVDAGISDGQGSQPDCIKKSKKKKGKKHSLQQNHEEIANIQ